MRRVEAQAAAKLNISLIVRSARSDGLHPLQGRFQSIDWYDGIVVDPGAEPGITGADGRPVVDGERNLAWRAALRVIDTTGTGVAVTLDKSIAVAAGLGGGSADAATTLAATAYAVGRTVADVADNAPSLGSDVPFCLVGGTADVRGIGDVVTPLATVADHAYAMVVPPVEVATPAVYGAWDDLGGPVGPVTPAESLPPSMREHLVVRNDLTDAAISVAPGIAEWRRELEAAWGRPVLLSGSGPSLFAFFLDRDEAASALAVAPRGARHVRAASPIGHGWAVSFDGAEAHDELLPEPAAGEDLHVLDRRTLAAVFR